MITLHNKSLWSIDYKSVVRNFYNSQKQDIADRYELVACKLYRKFYMSRKVRSIRRKQLINVMFVLSDLGAWKTEELYLKMKAHPRFNPVLRVVNDPDNPFAKEKIEKYLDNKGYHYKSLEKNDRLQTDFKADIIFYIKPYLYAVENNKYFSKNLRSLFCFVTYGFHNILDPYICNQRLQNFAWQYYFENEDCAKDTSRLMDNKGSNIQITGIPMGERLLKRRDSYAFPWKSQGKTKKRIIYAPHFSFDTDSYLHYSTFLVFGETMLELAEKYNDQVQFCFKPHPLLEEYLTRYWGKEKTEDYYDRWRTLPNGQVELGAYDGLFMTSDAMIHDCSSFSVEYMYTTNPVMFLTIRPEDVHTANLNSCAKEAFQLHYKGHNKEEIEQFILNVISGKDPLKQEREKFFKKSLAPIGGASASDNIIDCILGTKEFRPCYAK